MPATATHERTKYFYDAKRDTVKLVIEGVPPIKIDLTEQMILSAAEALKAGRAGKKEQPQNILS